MGLKTLESVGLDAKHGTPSPLRRTESAHRPTAELSQNIVGDKAIRSVAGGGPKWVGRRHVADREHTGVMRNPQFRCHPDETVIVEQFRRQPVRVGSHSSRRPKHGIGGCGRLSGAPLHGLAGDLVTRETMRHNCTVPGVQHHTDLGQSSPDPFPCPRVVADQSAFPGEVQPDTRGRPCHREIGGAADGCGTAAHHDHRFRGGQSIMCSTKFRADLFLRL